MTAGAVSAEVVYRFADVGHRTWDTLRPESFFASSQWLSKVEGTLSPQNAYIVIRDPSGRPLAGAAAYLVDPGAFQFLNPPALVAWPHLRAEAAPYLTQPQRHESQKLAAELPTELAGWYPAAVCVCPYSCAAGVAGQTSRPAAAAALVSAFGEVARHWSARSSAFLHVPVRDQRVLSGALRQAGYESAVLAAQCPMIMQWPSFGEYVASLTKRWRRNVRQELRAFDAAGLKLAVFGAEELTGRIDDLAPLYANLQLRYGHDPGLAEARATLEWIVSRFAGATRVVAVLDGDRVLAFHLLFLARGAIYTYITGQTYDERARSTFSYFHATYYEPVRMAMETGAGWIDFGIESYPAKLARGCQVRPLAGFFRPSSGIPGSAARYLELLDLGLRARFRQLGRPLPAGAIPGPGASA